MASYTDEQTGEPVEVTCTVPGLTFRASNWTKSGSNRSNAGVHVTELCSDVKDLPANCGNPHRKRCRWVTALGYILATRRGTVSSEPSLIKAHILQSLLYKDMT